MKIRVNALAGLVAVLILLAATIIFPNQKVAARDNISSQSGGAFVDKFNDGVISDSWVSLATAGSSIYEANGVLNMVIAEGSPPDNYNQLVDIGTTEPILKGDFDVQVSFQLDGQFYNALSQKNASLSVGVDRDEFGKVRDSINLYVRNFGYTVGEEHQDYEVGSGILRGYAPSDDLKGKLRITRQGSFVTAYYWDKGWQTLAQWEPELVHPTDDLSIVLAAFNWAPDNPSFWVKWDNLIAHYGNK